MPSTEDLRTRLEAFSGGEVFEIQPVILGGNPIDPKNKTVLTRQQHIEAVRYWNRVIRNLRKRGT